MASLLINKEVVGFVALTTLLIFVGTGGIPKTYYLIQMAGDGKMTAMPIPISSPLRPLPADFATAEAKATKQNSAPTATPTATSKPFSVFDLFPGGATPTPTPTKRVPYYLNRAIVTKIDEKGDPQCVLANGAFLSPIVLGPDPYDYEKGYNYLLGGEVYRAGEIIFASGQGRYDQMKKAVDQPGAEFCIVKESGNIFDHNHLATANYTNPDRVAGSVRIGGNVISKMPITGARRNIHQQFGRG